MLVHADPVGWLETQFCVTEENPHDEDKETRSKALGLQGPLMCGWLHVIVTCHCYTVGSFHLCCKEVEVASCGIISGLTESQ
jgi:hypothetical protein